jgi:hypothetical protein
MRMGVTEVHYKFGQPIFNHGDLYVARTVSERFAQKFKAGKTSQAISKKLQ